MTWISLWKHVWWWKCYNNHKLQQEWIKDRGSRPKGKQKNNSQVIVELQKHKQHVKLRILSFLIWKISVDMYSYLPSQLFCLFTTTFLIKWAILSLFHHLFSAVGVLTLLSTDIAIVTDKLLSVKSRSFSCFHRS